MCDTDILSAAQKQFAAAVRAATDALAADVAALGAIDRDVIDNHLSDALSDALFPITERLADDAARRQAAAWDADRRSFDMPHAA